MSKRYGILVTVELERYIEAGSMYHALQLAEARVKFSLDMAGLGPRMVKVEPLEVSNDKA